jgi:hypothetical protein
VNPWDGETAIREANVQRVPPSDMALKTHVRQVDEDLAAAVKTAEARQTDRFSVSICDILATEPRWRGQVQLEDSWKQEENSDARVWRDGIRWLGCTENSATCLN